MKHVPLIGIVSLLSFGVMPVASQTIEDGVREVRDGFVRMTFAARDGVCGNGENFFTTGHGNAHWESDCDAGPIFVSLERRNGITVDVDTHVGGRWRHRADATDLGMVKVADAVRFLLTLARTGTSAAEDAILPVALADSVTVWPHLGQMARDQSVSVDVRKKSLFWVGQLGNESALNLLVDFIQSESDNDLREHAVFALSQHDSDRSVTALRDLVEDRNENTSVREKAIFWLGQRHNGDRGYLRELYGKLEQQELRERVIFSVSQHLDEEDWRWLLTRATSPLEPMELRAKALFWAGQSRHDITDLIDLYDQLESRELKERLLFVYSQRRGDRQALDKLIQVAREDANRDLQSKAIFWLGQTKDPRAAEFLEGLIG